MPSTTSVLFAALCALASSVTCAKELDVLKTLLEGQYSSLDAHFAEVERRFAAGQLSELAYASAYRPFYQEQATLTSELNAWAQMRSASPYAHLARGIYFRKIGEHRRGGKYIAETPESAIAYMTDMHVQSYKDLQQALRLKPNWYLPALHLLNIAQHQGGAQGEGHKRALMELADRAYPSNFMARSRYMTSLEPRWGGSYEDMQAFVDECARTCRHPSHARWLEAMFKETQARDLPGKENSENRRSLYHQALALTRDADASFKKTYIPLAFSLCERPAYAQYPHCR